MREDDYTKYDEEIRDQTLTFIVRSFMLALIDRKERIYETVPRKSPDRNRFVIQIDD